MQKSIHSSAFSTRDLVLIPLFAALISIGAFIKIPIGLVPASLQTVFVLLAGMLLGARRGALAVLLYLLLGLIGLPVFTAGGGPGYILHPTFGYLLGMLPAAWLAGTIAQRNHRRDLPVILAGAVLGLLIIYSLGVTWLWVIQNLYLGKTALLFPLIKAGALIFLPADLLWCLVAALIGKRLSRQANQLK